MVKIRVPAKKKEKKARKKPFKVNTRKPRTPRPASFQYNCANCGKPHVSSNSTAKYCSDRCRAVAWQKLHPRLGSGYPLESEKTGLPLEKFTKGYPSASPVPDSARKAARNARPSEKFVTITVAVLPEVAEKLTMLARDLGMSRTLFAGDVLRKECGYA